MIIAILVARASDEAGRNDNKTQAGIQICAFGGFKRRKTDYTRVMIQNLMSRIRDLVDGGGDGLKRSKSVGASSFLRLLFPIHTIPNFIVIPRTHHHK